MLCPILSLKDVQRAVSLTSVSCVRGRESSPHTHSEAPCAQRKAWSIFMPCPRTGLRALNVSSSLSSPFSPTFLPPLKIVIVVVVVIRRVSLQSPSGLSLKSAKMIDIQCPPCLIPTGALSHRALMFHETQEVLVFSER